MDGWNFFFLVSEPAASAGESHKCSDGEGGGEREVLRSGGEGGSSEVVGDTSNRPRTEKVPFRPTSGEKNLSVGTLFGLRASCCFTSDDEKLLLGGFFRNLGVTLGDSCRDGIKRAS